MNLFSRTLLVALLSLSLVSPAYARECNDVTMPNSVTVDQTTLQLNGMGIREATVLSVDVYTAGLYVPTRSRNANALLTATGPFVLRMDFVRDVEAAQMREAFDTGFRNNAGSARTALAAQITELKRLMPNITDGTRVTFTYRPGTGLEVKTGNRVRGTVADHPQLRRAFLSLFIGSSPPNEGLKTGLLGGECD